MAFSFITRHSLAALALIFVFFFNCTLLGKADDYIPQIGAQGTPYGNKPQTGEGEGEGEGYGNKPHTGEGEGEGEGYGNKPHTGEGEGEGEGFPQTGTIGGDEPAEIVSKALLCFSNNYVYSSCEQSYRLTESGNINVPHEYTDQYCHGACLSETNLVLDCIDNILSHFLFYNRATIWDVRDTIKSGCSYGPKRGDFNVAEHIKARENSAHKSSKPVMFGLLLMIIYMGYYFVY